MTLHIPFLFHFNQHLTEFAALASRVCYRGLLETLLDSPIRANIHISGTLIQALKWLDPVPLDLIRAGLEEGKFELVGSTHAQNVPFATDDRDNRAQIRLHRQIIEETFGVRPTSFWISERCWRQSLAPVIAAEGYRTITLEDHILDQADSPYGQLIATSDGPYTLRVVRDDESLKHRFNFASWFGDSAGLFRYLEKSLEGPEHAYLAYAEDAEALGLWGYHHGVVPNQTWNRLASLLQDIHRHPSIETIHFSDLTDPVLEITPIQDGAAAWMDASLQQEDRPYHEGGYTSWFDFNANSEKLKEFRGFFDRLRAEIDDFSPKSEGAKKLRQLALHTFLTHQYEFGCIGIGGRDSRAWRGAEAAQVLLHLAQTGVDGFHQRLNPNNEDYQFFNFGQEAAVLTRYGARVLFWADTAKGALLVGNPGCVAPGKFIRLGIPPEPLRYKPPWLPDGLPFDQHLIEEMPPTRLGRYLPDWIWKEQGGPQSLAVRDMSLPGDEQTTLPAHHGAFSDLIKWEGRTVFEGSTPMEWDGEAFRAGTPPGLQIMKRLEVLPDALTMHYSLESASAMELEIEICTDIAGDYSALLSKGRRQIDFNETGGIKLKDSGDVFRLSGSVHNAALFQSECMQSLRLGLKFQIRLDPGIPKQFSALLARTRGGK